MYRHVAAALLGLSALVSTAGAQSPPACPDPLADLTSEKLEEIFSGLLATGATASAAVDALVDFAVSAVPIGTRLLVDGRCHEVQRVQVTGFHEGPHGHTEVDREAGRERGADVHRVASFERRWDDEYQGALRENWADLRAVASIGRADPDALELEVVPTSLCAGDSGEATATLRCGACGVSGEPVTFDVTAGAAVEPTRTATDDTGSARARVTADEPVEDAVLTVTTGALSATRAVRVESCCTAWTIDATFTFDHRDRPNGVDDHWTSEARFADLALGNYAGMELCPTEPEAIRRVMRARAAVPTASEVDGTFGDAGFATYDGAEWIPGTATGSPRWRLQVGPDDDEVTAACEAGGAATAETVHLFFSMRRGTVQVTWPKFVADAYLGFDAVAEVEVEKLRACAPFTLEIGFDDPDEYERATLRFTPARRR